MTRRATDNTIPMATPSIMDSIAELHSAWLGKTRSGKTYDAKTVITHLVKDRDAQTRSRDCVRQQLGLMALCGLLLSECRKLLVSPTQEVIDCVALSNREYKPLQPLKR